MKRKWLQDTQVRVERNAWLDDARLSIVRGGTPLWCVLGLAFAGLGACALVLPLHVVPSRNVGLYYVAMPLFGLVTIWAGLMGPFLRAYCVFDGKSRLLHYGYEMLWMRRHQTVPFAAITRVEITEPMPKNGPWFRVQAAVESEGREITVMLDEFWNDLRRAQRFASLPASVGVTAPIARAPYKP